MTPRRASERGVTLVELILVVGMMSIITVAVAGTLLVTIGPDEQAADRLETAHDRQLVTLYLPDDVQSAGPIDSTDTLEDAQLACAGAVQGANVLRLSWSEVSPPPTPPTYQVSYRTLSRDGENQMVRYSCTNGGPVQELVVAHALSTTSSATAVTEDQRVILSLKIGEDDPRTTSDERELVVVGVRRTPTTAPCVVLNHALNTATVAQSLAMPPTLGSTVTVTIVTAGSCDGPLRLHYDRGSGDQSVPFAAGGATLPAGESWNEGTYTLRIIGGTEAATDALQVTPPPCTATVTPTPTEVTRRASGDLLTPVAVSIATTGRCADLELSYEQTVGSEVILPLGSGPTYAGTIPVNGPWDVGPITVAVQVAGGGTLAGTGAFTVGTCTVTSVTTNPTQVALAGSNLGRTLAVTARVAAGSVCGSLQMVTSGGPGAPINLTRATATTYTGTIPTTGPWAAGPATVSVRYSGTTEVIGTGGFTVTPPPCAVTQVLASPATVARTNTNDNQARFLRPMGGSTTVSSTVTVTTTGACTAGAMQLRFTPRGFNTTVVRPLVAGGTPNTWTYVIAPNNQPGALQWTPGPKTLTVLIGGVAQPTTGTVTVQ